jgi:hypothetical protein
MAFGATLQDAKALAEACWQRLEFAYAKGFELEDGTRVTVDRTESLLPPTEVPWANPDVRVVQGTHLIVTRSIPA